MHMLEVYVRTNFINFGPTKLAKKNRKIMRTKYLLKLKHCGYNLKNNILSKRIFSF